MKTKKWVEDLLWIVVENAPTILTIGFAAYVIAIAQTTSISTETLLQWILAILGLLAVSELIERWRKLRYLEEIGNQTLKAVQSKFGQRARAEDFFTKRLPSLEPYLAKATTIWFCGYSLQRTIRENNFVLAQRLKDGADLKVMMVNPELLKDKPLVSEPGEKHDPLGSVVTISNLRWLAKQPAITGIIEVKFMNEEPRFNIIAIDPDEEFGTIFVEFYPQRWVHGSRPRMELTRGRDTYWYQYFKEQFELVWKDCKTVSLDTRLTGADAFGPDDMLMSKNQQHELQ